MEVTEKYGVTINIMVAIRMTNAIFNGAVSSRMIVLLMVKIGGDKKPSLLTLPVIAAIQSFAVSVKGKVKIMIVKTCRIPDYLGSDLVSQLVVYHSFIEQTIFNCS